MIERLARSAGRSRLRLSEFRYRDPVIDRARWCWPSRSPARPWTRWPRWKRPEARARTSPAIVNVHRQPGAPRLRRRHLHARRARRSAWPRTKAFTSLHWSTCTCWRCIWASAAGHAGCERAQRLVATWHDLPDLVGRTARSGEARRLRGTGAAASTSTRTSCILGAESTTPSRWRARSSSRRSATSTPRAIPPGEMKHGPIALIDEHMPVVAHRATGSRLRQDDQPGGAGEGPGRHGDRRGQPRTTS